MNKSSSDWMMGVQDLKLTLSNRSTSLLKSAQVEVRYYSDDNTLLDKKTLSFVNLAPGKSQTLAAPDHRTADHADYKILAAQGVANAYVKE
ncbi:MAG: FxLYD domain-containing protein, partial [Flavisolibacter sp.]